MPGWQEVYDMAWLHLYFIDICNSVEGDTNLIRINQKGDSVHPNLPRGADLGNE